MHQIDAEWLRQERPRTRMYAPPSSLKPIAGPDKDPIRIDVPKNQRSGLSDAPRERMPEPEVA
jgi:hypothetical protein